MKEKRLLTREMLERISEKTDYDTTKLAIECKLSVRQLQRLFQTSLGCSPQKWLNDLRIFRAQERLLLGQPVKQIAHEMGYGDPSYFCHQFKRLCGVTPSEFRQSRIVSGKRREKTH
jgi:AraC-like DNA-binding protein